MYIYLYIHIHMYIYIYIDLRPPHLYFAAQSVRIQGPASNTAASGTASYGAQVHALVDTCAPHTISH